jgi:hypothetical protein
MELEYFKQYATGVYPETIISDITYYNVGA